MEQLEKNPYFKVRMYGCMELHTDIHTFRYSFVMLGSLLC